MAEAWDRMNTHETKLVTVELFGTTINLSQDPGTTHLGTTVWDASVVLSKMFEKNLRKGEFSRSKLVGKRAIELGAGMGLGSIALALMDVNVTATDTVEVLPLLKINCERNAGRGKIHVYELDWMVPEQVATLQPPYDLVIAADCIYHEHIVPHFHRTVMDITNHKSTVLVVNELRSHSVHAAFMEAFSATHTVKKMPSSKLDDKYQHPLIQVFVCKLKRPCRAGKAQEGEGSEGEDAVEVVDAAVPDTTQQTGHQGSASVGLGEAGGAAGEQEPAASARVEDVFSLQVADTTS